MRSTSWAPSRKTRRRIKLLFVLAALTAGTLFALEARFAVFRIKTIDAVPPDILPHSAVLGTIAPGDERFWPAFFAARKKYTDLIEKYYPVSTRVVCCGWGKFRLEIKPNRPMLRVFWGGKYWYADGDGKIWLTLLKENKFIDPSEAMSVPVLSWASDRLTPVDFTKEHGNVFVSSLPMTSIKKWYDNLRALEWLDKVKFVQAGVSEGKPVVRLVFNDGGGGGEGANVLFDDDPSHWLEAGLAIKKLYPDMREVSANIFIDATYKGKILVKNKVQ